MGSELNGTDLSVFKGTGLNGTDLRGVIGGLAVRKSLSMIL